MRVYATPDLLPFDGCGGLIGDVIEHAVDRLDLGGYAAGNASDE